MNNSETTILLQKLKIAKQNAATRCLESYYEFFKLFFEIGVNAKLVDNWHIKSVCDELQRYAIDLKNENIPDFPITVFNMPPSSSKSSLISVLFPAWLWLHMPNAVIISSSFSLDLSMSLSRKTKNVLTSELYQELFQPWFKAAYGKNLSMDEAECQYTNNFGGERYPTSTGGTVTGHHAHLIIVDDGLKVQSSDSPSEVEKCNTFFAETLSNRKKDNERTKTIIVMQRLNTNDLVGYLEQKQIAFKHFVFPAELTNDVKPEKYKEYYKEGLLDPIRLSHNFIEERKLIHGSYSYASQYLQKPYEETGGILRKDYFTTIKASEIIGYENIIWNAYIDGAYTKNVNNDPTGILICAKVDNKLIIRDWISEWLEFPDIISRIKGLKDAGILTNESKVKIEPKATGISLQQVLVKEGINAISIRSKLVNQNKMSRARLASPFAEAGRIQLLLHNKDIIPKWHDKLIFELISFPNSAHDEAIDCLGYAVEENLNKETSYSVGNSSTKVHKEYTPEEIEEREYQRYLKTSVKNGGGYVGWASKINYASKIPHISVTPNEKINEV